jgi:hypothetical protein
MRLIDADKIEINEECTFSGKGIKAFLNAVPTAYDVDKVVEQLEENAKYFQSEADELAQKGDWGTATDLQGRATAYRNVAKTVKSGGIE